MSIRARISGLALVMLFAPLGCDEDKSDTKPAAEDAAAQTGPAVDPDLAEAMEAASKKKGNSSGQGVGGENGPPPTGIFGPGEADAQLAKGAPAKITLGSEGSEPRIKLESKAPAAGWKRNGTLELTIRAGRNQLPAVTAQIAFDAPKAAAKPAEGAAANDGAQPVVAVIKKTSIAAGQLGGAAELERQVNKLQGSRVKFKVLPSGASDEFSVDLAKDAAKELDSLLRPLSEVLAAVTMPYPDKAVGKGAYWMITSRETVMGVDVVAYRMVRVEEVEGTQATLSLNIKRYAADNELSLPGVPPEAKLEQFQSIAEGQVTVSANAPLLPASGNLRQNFVAMLSPPAGGDPSQRLTAQSASEASLEFPVSGAKAVKKPAAGAN